MNKAEPFWKKKIFHAATCDSWSLDLYWNQGVNWAQSFDHNPTENTKTLIVFHYKIIANLIFLKG
jgi:hypothetical protein